MFDGIENECKCNIIDYIISISDSVADPDASTIHLPNSNIFQFQK